MALQAASELNQTQRIADYYNISVSCYINAYYIWTDQATTFHIQLSSVLGYYFNPAYSGLYYYALDLR